MDDHKQPLTELRRLLNMERSNELLAETAGAIRAGDLKKALAFAIAARDRSPENDNAWVSLAGVYARMDNKAEALQR